jgi:hypothetical protein
MVSGACWLARGQVDHSVGDVCVVAAVVARADAVVAISDGERPPTELTADEEDRGQLTVTTEDMAGGKNGELNWESWTITLGTHLFETGTPAARIKTLTHELAHWFDLGPRVSVLERDAAEIVAEAVAYIVGQRLGSDTSSYSAGYVASWARGDSAKLHALAERIDQAARPILAVFD